MKELFIDFETFSGTDLKTCGMHRYVEDPDFEIMLCAYAVGDNPVQCIDLTTPKGVHEFQYVLDYIKHPDYIKIAHNAPFEMACTNAQFPGHVRLRNWRCSAVQAAYLALPRSLDGLSQVLNLEKPKDKIGDGLIRLFCKPQKSTKAHPETRRTRETDPEKWEQFKGYCVRDVEAEREAWRRMQKMPVPAFEWEYWFMDQDINNRGMRVDTELVESAIAIDKHYRRNLTEEAKRLTGLANPNSVSQLMEWINKDEDLTESLAKAEVARLLKTTDDGMLQRVLELRQELAKTSVKKYAALKKAVCKDDRLRGSLLFYGASRTHRWSGKMFQPHNLPQNHLPDLEDARDWVKAGDFEAVDFLYPSVSRVLSELIRTAIIPAEGKKFVVADFSAIEARVIAWLAGEEWVLEVFRGHGKIYEATASQMFKVPFEAVTKGSSLRKQGKVAVLALGYGGGEKALEAMDYDHAIPPEDRDTIKKMWRSANPNIVKWWWAVGDAAIQATGNPGVRYRAGKVSFIRENGFLFCEMPDGNRLCYPKPRIRWDTKYEREKLTYEGTDQLHPKWGEIPTYGPKLVENCLSGDALVLTQRGWARLDSITLEDLVWDGIDFVKHMGLTYMGLSHTISVDGVHMTPEHKVLTKEGWKDASSCQGHHRAETRIPDRRGLPRVGRQEITVGCTLLGLWKDEAHEGEQLPRQHIMRMHEEGPAKGEESEAWYGPSPCVLGMAVHAGPVSAPNT